MQSRDLYQLVYISTGHLGDEMNTAERELHHIMRVSERNNQEAGITGAMVWTGQHFAQVIEGGEQAVSELYTRIGKDYRHSDIRCLSFVPTASRCFPFWTMALLQGEPEDNRMIDALGERLAPTSGNDPVDNSREAGHLVRLLRQISARGDVSHRSANT